jgi:hypothetical protein
MTVPRPSPTWAAALVFLAVATALLNLPTLLALDTQRIAPPAAIARHGGALVVNDTDTFIWHIDNFATRFGASPGSAFRRDVFFPFPEFDCPVSFVFAGGIFKWITGWPGIRILNIFTLVAVFLNGVAAFGFLRAIAVAGPVAAVAAVGYMVPNYVLYAQHMGHMNYVQLQWVAFAFWGLVAVMRPGAGWWSAIGLGLAMGFQLLSSPSFSLYLGYVGLPVFAAAHWLATPAQDRIGLGRLAARGLIAVAVALAVASPYLVARLDLMPAKHRVPGPAFTWSKFYELLDPAHPVLFVGTPLFVLGVLAAVWWWRHRNPVGTAMICTLVATALCMLPAIPPAPYWALREYAPLFDRMRVPTRFFPLAFLMFLGLVGAYLTARAAGGAPRAKWGYAVVLLLALLVGCWLSSPWFFEIPFEQPLAPV